MKRIAFGALWLALIVQIGWTILNVAVLNQTASVDPEAMAITGYFIAFAVARGRSRWMAVVARLLMSLDFLLSVADRLGVFGPVGWGNFTNFVAYTRQVNAFLPGDFAPVLAVLATIAETVLGVALLLGFRTRLAALGASGLTILYGVAMTISGMTAGQFHYTVFVLCTAMLALATVDASALSVDAVVRRLRGPVHTSVREPAANAARGSRS